MKRKWRRRMGRKEGKSKRRKRMEYGWERRKGRRVKDGRKNVKCM